jgi:hypothetical protein
MWCSRQGSSILPAGSGKDSLQHRRHTITSSSTSSKETRYGLAAQAEKMEIMTENFANYVTTKRSSQALALVAALEDKLALDAANRIALQNITN